MTTYRVSGGPPYKVVQTGSRVLVLGPPTRTEDQFLELTQQAQAAAASSAASATAAQNSAALVGAPAGTAINAWWQGYSSAIGRSVATAANAAAARTAIQAAPLDPTLPADTGWVTGILPTTASYGNAGPLSGSGANEYGGRILRGWCTISFRVTYNGATLTAGSDGNIGDNTITTISDARFRPPRNIQGMATVSGVSTWFCRIGKDGVLQLTHGGFPGQTLAAGAAFDIELAWQV